jgi:hypothetical protein
MNLDTVHSVSFVSIETPPHMEHSNNHVYGLDSSHDRIAFSETTNACLYPIDGRFKFQKHSVNQNSQEKENKIDFEEITNKLIDELRGTDGARTDFEKKIFDLMLCVTNKDNNIQPYQMSEMKRILNLKSHRNGHGVRGSLIFLEAHELMNPKLYKQKTKPHGFRQRLKDIPEYKEESY